MKNAFSIVFIAGLFIWPGCQSDNKTATSAPAAPAAPPDTRPAVYLEGLYATSTAEGETVEALFDADANTGWHTRPGTGPDEGIMLYFASPIALQGVALTPFETPAKSDKDAPAVSLYVNGAWNKDGGWNDPIMLAPDTKPVRSLYIRFNDTGKETTATRSEDGANISIVQFPPQANIGVKNLTIFNHKGEALRVVPPQPRKGKVTASSTLTPESAYGPSNLFDARKEFVWVEGNTANSGEGETLRFDFDQPVNITEIQIWNGYQRSAQHRSANARVRDFSLGLADGTQTNTYTLRDTEAGQKIPLATPLKGTSFVLTIKSAYPGARYKDLAISDLLFYDGETPFTLLSDRPAARRSELRARGAQLPIAGLLDRRLSNRIEHGDGAFTTQSLILRSDGTFVMYTSEVGADDSEVEVLADGNWELTESNAVKVFGKWYDLSLAMEYYKGPVKKEVTRIFNDLLTIEGQTLKGGKLIGTFYF